MLQQKACKRSEIVKGKYLKAKRHAKRIVYKAKTYAEDETFANIKQNDNHIFKMVKSGKTAQTLLGNTYIKDENGNLCFTNATTRQAWQDHYKNLLNTKLIPLARGKPTTRLYCSWLSTIDNKRRNCCCNWQHEKW